LVGSACLLPIQELDFICAILKWRCHTFVTKDVATGLFPVSSKAFGPDAMSF